jgi:hypothetical protein
MCPNIRAMQSILTTFLLFLAAIVALLTYLIVPSMSIMTLMTAAAVALAIGVWWHWSQFSIDYQRATWPEQLRSYASYVIVLVVILLSYGFYVFAWSGSSLQDLAAQAGSAARNVGRQATQKIASSASRASNTLFSDTSESSALLNLGGNTNRRANSNTLTSASLNFGT